MIENRFNYYGFDKETYKSCLGQIRQANRRQLIILNTWFLVLNIVYLLLSCLSLFGVAQEFAWVYLAFTVLAVIIALVVGLFPRFSERISAGLAYGSTMILFAYGLVISVMYPYMPAVMYHILSILIALMYIGNMLNTILVTAVGVGVFLLTSYKYKTFSIAYYDTYNAIIVAVLAMGLHYMFQRLRMHQFVLFQKDLEVQRELEIKSRFDGLTGLMNRTFFFSYAEELIKKQRYDYSVLCLIDLDGFKEINDTLGHQMGDKVIQTAGRIILEALGFVDQLTQIVSEWEDCQPLAGRLGGDEFIVFLCDGKSREVATALLEEMLRKLNAARLSGLGGIHASMGATELLSADNDTDDAYRRADIALYEAKRAGKNQLCFAAHKNGQ